MFCMCWHVSRWLSLLAGFPNPFCTPACLTVTTWNHGRHSGEKLKCCTSVWNDSWEWSMIMRLQRIPLEWRPFFWSLLCVWRCLGTKQMMDQGRKVHLQRYDFRIRWWGWGDFTYGWMHWKGSLSKEAWTGLNHEPLTSGHRFVYICL